VSADAAKRPEDSRAAPLRNPNFRLLMGFRIFTILSYQGVAVTVGWHVYELTRDPWMLGEHRLHQTLRVGPRDEDSPVDLKYASVKFLAAEDVGYRFSGEPARPKGGKRIRQGRESLGQPRKQFFPAQEQALRENQRCIEEGRIAPA